MPKVCWRGMWGGEVDWRLFFQGGWLFEWCLKSSPAGWLKGDLPQSQRCLWLDPVPPTRRDWLVFGCGTPSEKGSPNPGTFRFWGFFLGCRLPLGQIQENFRVGGSCLIVFFWQLQWPCSPPTLGVGKHRNDHHKCPCMWGLRHAGAEEVHAALLREGRGHRRVPRLPQSPRPASGSWDKPSKARHPKKAYPVPSLPPKLAPVTYPWLWNPAKTC